MNSLELFDVLYYFYFCRIIFEIILIKLKKWKIINNILFHLEIKTIEDKPLILFNKSKEFLNKSIILTNNNKTLNFNFDFKLNDILNKLNSNLQFIKLTLNKTINNTNSILSSCDYLLKLELNETIIHKCLIEYQLLIEFITNNYFMKSNYDFVLNPIYLKNCNHSNIKYEASDDIEMKYTTDNDTCSLIYYKFGKTLEYFKNQNTNNKFIFKFNFPTNDKLIQLFETNYKSNQFINSNLSLIFYLINEIKELKNNKSDLIIKNKILNNKFGIKN